METINTIDHDEKVTEVVVTKNLTIIQILYKMINENCRHVYLVDEYREPKKISAELIIEALKRGFPSDTSLEQLELSMLLEKRILDKL